MYTVVMLILQALGISVVINVALFLIAYRRQTDKLTDLSYSLSFVLVAAFAYSQSLKNPAHILLLGLITVWAVRLGSYLLIRINKIGRDKRFDKVRDKFWAFAKFWILQAITVIIVLLPSLFFFQAPEPLLDTASIIGTLVWGIGLMIETYADMQKFVFILTPKNKGKWIESGLWKYSRHPNYLGEILVWVGIYLYTVPVLSTAQAVIGLAGPLFITGMLLFVTGVPPLEKSADRKWGNKNEYKEYKKRTGKVLPKVSLQSLAKR